jgi:hypothetical protein
MLDKLLRKTPVIAVSLAALPFFVHANEQSELMLNKDIPGSTGQLANFMAFTPSKVHDVVQKKTSTIEEKKINGNLGTKQPSRFDDGDYSFFIEGDFLYWQAKQDGLEYVVKTSTPGLPDFFGSSGTLKGHLKDINFDWGPGSRIALGYHTSYDYWDLAATWTHFHEGSTSREKAGSGGLSAVWLLLGSSDTTPPAFNVTSANARWHLCYDVLDIGMSRNYFVSRALTLTPKAGIRNAWIDQLTKYSYNLVTTTMGPEKVRLKNNFYGVGAVLGLDLNYYLGRNFSLWGKLAGSLLTGFFHVEEKAVVEGLSPGGAPVSYNLNDHVAKLTGNLETGIGLQWERDISPRKSHVAIFAGFEFISWLSQNQLKNFTHAGSNNNIFFDAKGDLTLMGFTLGMRFDF